jgi:hypothetical protein
MNIESSLRSHRKALVTAAEAAIRDTGSDLPEKTQLNRLVAICGEATCAEEITSFLYYQASRRDKLWPRGFVDTVIAKIQGPLETLSGTLRAAPEAERDRARVAAWRVYAVFLARAFTYASSVRGQQEGQDHDRTRR